MNTIKLFFATSGDLMSIQKDFPLYQGSYQNKLLNVFIPTSILQPNFTVEQDGATIADYVAGTAVKIGTVSTASNGKVIKSQPYYMRFLKTLYYQNVEYALYERMLPQEFTTYAGQGANAPLLVANAVVIKTDTTPAQVLRIITTQTCSLEVLPSANLDTDEAIEATTLEKIEADINSINGSLAAKQNINDDTLDTNAKTIVGAINEVKGVNDTQTMDIESNTEAIANNRNDIDYLIMHAAQPEEYIGQLSGSVLPSNQILSAYVAETAGREPKNADVVIFVLEIAGQTDKIYKYTYSVGKWNGYEIPPIEEASNGEKGILAGTYGVGKTYDTLVDISGGEILDIYVKDPQGNYRNIREYAVVLQTTIENIINGNTSVGRAVKAIQDALGNSIVDTYLTINAGATKAYVRDYALPREFNDVYYISADGYAKTVPTTPPNGVQFTEMSDSVGDTTLFQIDKTNDADFELSSKNSYQTNVYVSASKDCVVQFRLTTQCRKAGEDWQDLAIELTSTISLVQDDIQKVSFGTPFTALGEQVITLTDGDLVRQTLDVITQTSEMIVFDVFSNETYPSTYSMNVLSQRVVVTQGYMGEQQSITGTGELDGATLNFVLSEATQIHNNVEALFTLFAPVGVPLTATTPVVLSLNGQNIRLVTPYNQDNGTATLADLAQVAQLADENGTTYTFKGFITVSATDEISVLVDEDNIRDYVREQDTAYIGKIVQVDFNGVLENNEIVATLDTSVADFEFSPNTQYIIHIYLPLVTLTGDLDNSYPVYLVDKDGNRININCITERDLGQTATVGDLCQLQNYLPTIGYTWDFSAVYKEPQENGQTVRYVYTDTIIRETNPSMTAAEFASNLAAGKLKAGTTVLVTTGSATYKTGHSYLVTSTLTGGTLTFSTTDITPKTQVLTGLLYGSDWQESDDYLPYPYFYYGDTVFPVVPDNAIIELINDQPIVFAKYGLAVQESEGDDFPIFLAINKPAEDEHITIKLGVTII